MNYSESELLPISALQHLLFCQRQCALIHVEQVWAENYLTIQGQHLHKKAHDGPHESRHGVRVARGLRLHSLRLGLVGQADVVEFEQAAGSRGGSANMRVTPIEYKRGRPKKDDSDRVQLCAQALCLEEMLRIEIATGELFYGKKRRRTRVEFDSSLRDLTESTALRLHELIASRRTPIARFELKCERCSLIEICLPDVTGRRRSAAKVIDRYFADNLSTVGPESDPLDQESIAP